MNDKNKILILALLLIVSISYILCIQVNTTMNIRDWLELIWIEILAQELLTLINKK